MKLIVGLGNPGVRYEHTRHNIGFLVTDCLATRHAIALAQSLCGSAIGEGVVESHPVMLAKPEIFMNRSGSAVACLLRARAIAIADLMVINDDLDLPFGRIRIRPSGSAGGHRGLISIAKELGGAPFLRVRVGIGRPPEGCSAVDYVLDRFSGDELDGLEAVVARAADAIACLLRDGMERAMVIYNRANCKP